MVYFVIKEISAGVVHGEDRQIQQGHRDSTLSGPGQSAASISVQPRHSHGPSTGASERDVCSTTVHSWRSHAVYRGSTGVLLRFRCCGLCVYLCYVSVFIDSAELGCL